MSGMVDFLTYFGAYAILFLVFILVILVGAMIGITLRKRKNRMELEVVAVEAVVDNKDEQEATE